MKSIIVSLKDDASKEAVAAAKQKVLDNGGKITSEFTLIKGFSAEIPEDQVGTLEKDDAVENVELDGQVQTQ